jgi:hypothetical protein
MEWAKLGVEAIKALAWPLTLIAILILFKRPILARLPHITKAKFPGGFEFELGELVSKAERVFIDANKDSLCSGPCMLAVDNTSLAIESEILSLAQLSISPKEATHQQIPQLISQLEDASVLSGPIANGLRHYIGITNRAVHTSTTSGEEMIKILSIGTSLLAPLRYLSRVQYLLRDFDGHLLWHMHGREDRNRYYFWSAIAASLPTFDYSYEAFREAATKFNTREEERAREASRKPRAIDIPTTSEFLRILEFRRRELLRVLQGEWWTDTKWRELREWHWPEEWGDIGWNQPIVDSWNEAQEELLRTDATIERYAMKEIR